MDGVVISKTKVILRNDGSEESLVADRKVKNRVNFLKSSLVKEIDENNQRNSLLDSDVFFENLHPATMVSSHDVSVGVEQVDYSGTADNFLMLLQTDIKQPRKTDEQSQKATNLPTSLIPLLTQKVNLSNERNDFQNLPSTVPSGSNSTLLTITQHSFMGSKAGSNTLTDDKLKSTISPKIRADTNLFSTKPSPVFLNTDTSNPLQRNRIDNATQTMQNADSNEYAVSLQYKVQTSPNIQTTSSFLLATTAPLYSTKYGNALASTKRSTNTNSDLQSRSSQQPKPQLSASSFLQLHTNETSPNPATKSYLYFYETFLPMHSSNLPGSSNLTEPHYSAFRHSSGYPFSKHCKVLDKNYQICEYGRNYYAKKCREIFQTTQGRLLCMACRILRHCVNRPSPFAFG